MTARAAPFALVALLAACSGASPPPGPQGTGGPKGPDGPPGPPGVAGLRGAQGAGGVTIAVEEGARAAVDGGILHVFSPAGPSGAAGPAGMAGANGANGTVNSPIAAPTTFSGTVTLSAGLRFAGRVVKTAAMTGLSFQEQTVAGTNVCPANFNPCTSWQVMSIEALSAPPPFDAPGWVIGSFHNRLDHLRSLANGQDSTVCPTEMLLTKAQSANALSGLVTPGGLRCEPVTKNLPVWCCRR